MRFVAGKYKEDERIPSVREYAVLLEVNANTTVKAYDLLATDEIIYNKRGLGTLFPQEPRSRLSKTRKKEFMKERLPELARQMQLLDISIDEVKEELEKNLQKDKDMMTLFILKYIFIASVFALYIIRCM